MTTPDDTQPTQIEGIDADPIETAIVAAEPETDAATDSLARPIVAGLVPPAADAASSVDTATPVGAAPSVDTATPVGAASSVDTAADARTTETGAASGSAANGVAGVVAAASVSVVGRAAGASVPAGPRTRWAAIIWGLVLAAIAGGAVWVLFDADRRDALADWVSMLSVPAAIAYGVLLLGALALVIGVVGVARRIQRAVAART